MRGQGDAHNPPAQIWQDTEYEYDRVLFSREYADRGDLFSGLSIWNEEKYRQLQGTYPVIFMSFANVKASTCRKMEYKITELLARLYEQNSYLLDCNILSDNEKKYFHKIQPGMGDEIASGAVNAISEFIYRYYGKNVIIILDEYDTPMQEAWISGYWDEAVAFFRGFSIPHSRQMPTWSVG